MGPSALCYQLIACLQKKKKQKETTEIKINQSWKANLSQQDRPIPQTNQALNKHIYTYLNYSKTSNYSPLTRQNTKPAKTH